MATSKIKIGRVTVRGKVRYRVNRMVGSKRKRTLHDSKAAAEAEVARLRNEVATSGSVWNEISADERSRIIDVWRQAQAKGLDLQKMLHTAPTAVTEKPIGKVRDELLEAKRASGKTDDYLKVLKLVLNQFCKGRELQPVHAVTFGEVESFLNTKSLAYRATLRARISTLFNFAVRRGYRVDNPCHRLESVTYHKPSPEILTPLQVGRCIVWLNRNPRGMAWFILAAFYGLRPDEAQKTTWNKINLHTGTVTVDKQTTKIRQRRIVECPHPKALELLKEAKRLESVLPIDRYIKRWIQTCLRQLLRLRRWPKDVTRHSAASYWLAIKPDAAYVSEQLGNSVSVLKRNYKALVTREQAVRFWGEVADSLNHFKAGMAR